MKLAAIILLALCCCAYVSVTQQRQFMSRRYPLPYYYNSYFDSPQLSRNNWMMRQAPFLFGLRNNYIQPNYPSPQNPSFDHQMLTPLNDEEDNESDDYSTDELIMDHQGAEAQGRARLPFRGSAFNNGAVDKKNSRIFYFGNSLLYGKGGVVTIVTSTLTTTSIITCAASSQFISTTACRRRRRNAQVIDQLRQQQEDDDRMMVDYVSPTQVQSIEPSAPPPQIHDDDFNDGLSLLRKEIESSSDQYVNDENTNNARKKRSFFFRSTFTSYFLSGTTSTKTIDLGIGGCPACVSCLPGGIVIC